MSASRPPPGAPAGRPPPSSIRSPASARWPCPGGASSAASCCWPPPAAGPARDRPAGRTTETGRPGGARRTARSWRTILVTGAGLAVYQTAYYVAIDLAGLAVATVVTLGAGPVLIAVGGHLTGIERLTRGAVDRRRRRARRPGPARPEQPAPAPATPAGAHRLAGIGFALLPPPATRLVTLLTRRGGAIPDRYDAALGGFAVGAVLLAPLARHAGPDRPDGYGRDRSSAVPRARADRPRVRPLLRGPRGGQGDDGVRGGPRGAGDRDPRGGRPARRGTSRPPRRPARRSCSAPSWPSSWRSGKPARRARARPARMEAMQSTSQRAGRAGRARRRRARTGAGGPADSSCPMPCTPRRRPRRRSASRSARSPTR